MTPNILIIDDDDELFCLLNDYLSGEGFRCAHAADGVSGLKEAQRAMYDAIILDVMLPSMSGFDVLREIRSDEKIRFLPILMLTARGDEVDRVVGLEIGADDYLGKPFSPRELTARLRALLRRAKRPPEESGVGPVRIEGLSIDKAALTVRVNEESVSLTYQEMLLLESLAQGIGSVVNRDILYANIFGRPAYPMDRSLDMLVSRLRRKIGRYADGGERIKAIRGEGYMLLSQGKT